MAIYTHENPQMNESMYQSSKLKLEREKGDGRIEA